MRWWFCGGRYKPTAQDGEFVKGVYEGSVIAGKDIPWTEAGTSFYNLQRKMLAFKHVFLAKWKDFSDRPFSLRSNRSKWIMATLLVLLKRVGIDCTREDAREFIYNKGDNGRKFPFKSFYIKTGRGSWTTTPGKEKRPVLLAATRDDVTRHMSANMRPQWLHEVLKEKYTEVAMQVGGLSESPLKLVQRISAVLQTDCAGAFVSAAVDIMIDHFYECELDSDLHSDAKLTKFRVNVALGPLVALCLRLLRFHDQRRKWENSISNKSGRPVLDPALFLHVTVLVGALFDSTRQWIADLHVGKVCQAGQPTEITFTDNQMRLFTYKCGWLLRAVTNAHTHSAVDCATTRIFDKFCHNLKIEGVPATDTRRLFAEMKQRLPDTTT